MANKHSFLEWLRWLCPGAAKKASDVLLEWPYPEGSEFMTPAVVWSSYVHEHRLRLLWELQLRHCAKRIHEQRIEIKRLAAENEMLKKRIDPNASNPS